MFDCIGRCEFNDFKRHLKRQLRSAKIAKLSHQNFNNLIEVMVSFNSVLIKYFAFLEYRN